MTLLPQIRSQLHAAGERRAHSRRTRLLTSLRRHPRRGWHPTPLIAAAVGLGLAGVAFASGVIQFGAPAPTSPVRLFTAPRTGDGALAPGTVRVLAISAPDPAGGAPWGMREFSTSRGLGCIEVARIADGKLVALGQDDAFANDGRFHELSVASGGAEGDWCAALDRYNRLYINQTWGEQPASAWQSRCYAPGTPPGGHLRGEPACPLQDERNLYFGLLGPDAKSVSYVLEGQRHTLATSGPEGAYLLVTRAKVDQLLRGVGAGGVVPVDGPITEIHYRDGATCHITSRSWIGGAYACTPSLPVPVGYVAPQELSYTHAQAEAPLTVKVVRAHADHALGAFQRYGAHPGRYELRLTFTSRVALTNADSHYRLIWYVPGQDPLNNSGTRETESDVAAGQRVSFSTGPLPPGITHGTVSLAEPDEVFKNKSEVVYQRKYEKEGILVASFSVRVP